MRASCLAFCNSCKERLAWTGIVSQEPSREQKASHRKRLRRRGAVCGVGAPLRCAPASPSSRLLASGPAALATPPHTLFQQPAGGQGTRPDSIVFLEYARDL